MVTKFNLQIMLNCFVYTLNFAFLVPPYEQEQFKVFLVFIDKFCFWIDGDKA
jgi:hypothetical protein